MLRKFIIVFSIAFWLFVLFCAVMCFKHGVGFITSHPAWAIVRWLPVWYKWVTGIVFVLASLHFMLELTDEDDMEYPTPYSFWIYMSEGVVIILAVASALWLPIVIFTLMFAVTVKVIDMVRNRRLQNCRPTTA
ncbi:MAG: hypothetical protein NTW11_02815 [Candidatus Staskawiczbacteria bacterium]|nr:hypothetical protein [Candidatus Staskawiczbacteria bacterium]